MDKRRLLWLFNAGRVSLTYLLRDDFTTAESAPVTSPRTCEPTGTIVFTDTGNKYSITGGELVNTALGENFQGFISQSSYDRTTPKIAKIRFKTTTLDLCQFGFGGSSLGTANRHLMYATGGNQVVFASSRFPSARLGFATNTYYECAILLLPTGGAIFAKGGAYSNWTLAHLTQLQTIGSDSNSANPVYFQMWGWTNMAQNVSGVAVLDSDILSLSSFADYSETNPQAGTIFASSADGIIYTEWVAQTGATFEIMLRRTDDNNCWIARCSQSGSTVKIIEKNAGVETERASGSITFTNGVRYQIMPFFVGNRISVDVFSALTTDVRFITYTSATFNNSTVGGKLVHSASVLMSFSKTVPASISSKLDAIQI